MSKELVIGSNRHETKVAVLEDDQLVELYFQRANEYSLAGSIHKGQSHSRASGHAIGVCRSGTGAGHVLIRVGLLPGTGSATTSTRFPMRSLLRRTRLAEDAPRAIRSVLAMIAAQRRAWHGTTEAVSVEAAIDRGRDDTEIGMIVIGMIVIGMIVNRDGRP